MALLTREHRPRFCRKPMRVAECSQGPGPLPRYKQQSPSYPLAEAGRNVPRCGSCGPEFRVSSLVWQEQVKTYRPCEDCEAKCADVKDTGLARATDSAFFRVFTAFRCFY